MQRLRSMRAAMRALSYAVILPATPCALATSPVRALPRTEIAAREATELMTPARVAELRAVVSAVISPDGARIAYVLGVPRKPGVDEDGGSWTELHVLDRQSGAARPYVTGKVNVGSVAWTPDGRALAYLAKRDGDKQTSLYVLPIDGGEARREVALETGIRDFSFAPDGKRVALVADEAEDAARKASREKGFKQEVYEENEAWSRLWIAELGGGAPRRLDVEGHVYQVHWSPRGDAIAITRSPTPLVDDQYMLQRVAVVSPEDGRVLGSVQNPGKLGSVTWSPDGTRLALTAAADIHDPTAGRLLVADAFSGRTYEVLPNYEADVDACAWQDASHVLLIASHGCETALEKVTVDAESARDLKTLLPAGTVVLTGLDLSRDGSMAALLAQSPAHPPEVYTMQHGDGAPRRLTSSNEWLSDVRLASQEVVRFTARDGLQLEGVLVHPLERAAGLRVPLILYVHGGPEAHEQNGWQTSYSKPGQVAAARGFAVFYPNYRGSTGRGIEFAKLSQGDAAGKEFDDLVDAVDHLVANGSVDAKRVGVTGGSYGGYATAWCSTRFTDRFAAGVMFVGISNKISKIGTTDIPQEEFYVHALHRVWDDWQFFLERSPVTWADGAHTPLLILHGKDDPRVNPGQSREMYRHLKLRGQAPVRLVLYPGEGHGNRKACARLDYNLRMMQWFEHYLNGPGGEPPPPDLEYAGAGAGG